MPTTAAAFAFACITIVSTLFIGFLTYYRMISESEREHHEKYLAMATLLVRSAMMAEKDAPAGTFPQIIETLWRQIGAHPADEYICIVDSRGHLIRHTARPETVGLYCGDNPIFPAGSSQADRLMRLVEEQVPYVGAYVASSGQRQIAAFVPIPGRKWTLGLHRSRAALQKEIERELLPLRYAFLVVGGGLVPLAMLFIFVLFHRHNRQLHNASEALRSFYMTADDMAIITTVSTGPDRKIIEFSPGAERIFGYARQEILGQPVSLLYHHTEQKKLPRVFAELLESKKGVRREAAMIRQDGQPVNALCTIHPRYDTKGRIIGTWAVVIDISEQKEKEERLRLNEERFARLLKLTQMTELSQHELVRYALEEAVALTRSEVGYFHYFDEDTQHIRLTAWSEGVLHKCQTESEVHYPLAAAGIWADCVREGKAVIHNDYAGCPHKKGMPEGHFPLHRHMSVPVFERGKIVAICGVGNKETLYNEADSQHLTLFLNTCVQI
ncbi:MAG TPA: GAF domain-containing protein, partial [Desulfurivibrionaceae bacterium]|nr:GAF domain-containing protein [Desulfurivibrionaceae bacterium]